MWKKTYSKLYQNVKKNDAWSILIDVNNWPTWCTDLEYCHLEGSFKVGNHFILKTKNSRYPIKVMITEVDTGNSFTDSTIFFGAKMHETIWLQETSQGLLFTHTLMVTGPLQWFWVMLAAKNVTNTIPDSIDKLINLARKSS